MTAAGIAQAHTDLETSAVAVLQRHNTSSIWSPRPAPQRNPLFGIIASHWGFDAAHDVMQRILSGRSPPRKAGKTNRIQSPAGCNVLCGIDRVPVAPPVIPRRQASLRSGTLALTHKRRTSSQDVVASDTDDEDAEVGIDPARKIWAEMRRMSTATTSMHRSSSPDEGSCPTAFPTAMGRVSRGRTEQPPESSECVAQGPWLNGSENSRWDHTPADPLTATHCLGETGIAFRGAKVALGTNEKALNPGSERMTGQSATQTTKRGQSTPAGGDKVKKEKEPGRWSWGGWW
ncbi:hypothetical protein VTK73DRAFT_7101 [Phialemonium thermophilum]|uniref:Uncharacterized protein n=1 Tax=Phialemonium thermophilum TaxID=223376 RepID=A0ABR3XTQ8_9PEZI